VRSTFLGVSGAVIGIGLALAGCSSGGTSAATKPPTHKPTVSSSHSPKAAAQTGASHQAVGDACGQLPATGKGSVAGMAAAPVATAVSQNPQLTDLAHAISEAGMTKTMNSAKAITLFAPDDSAFHALGAGDLKTLMASKADLAKLVEYHIVKSRVTPADLAAGKPLLTQVGLSVHPAKSGDVYKVNTARVTCGNIQTTNGTIYIVDKVLIPTT
jgi:uncharacterized surface protein with fasciclin (FAS1) repeats